MPVQETDEQQPLLDAVLQVADPLDASVILAKAYEPEVYDQRVEKLELDDSPTPDAVARRSRAVRDLAAELDDAGVEYGVRGGIGEEGNAILDLANSINPDLLYVQGKSRSPAGKALFGSTAQQVLLNAPCPVTYVQP